MGDVDPNLALFASWVRDEESKERAAKREAKAVRAEEEKARALVKAKDDAAAALKRVRSNPNATADDKAAADAAYREALAAVVAAETGTTPAWAPEASTGEAGPGTAGDQTAAEDPSEDEVAHDGGEQVGDDDPAPEPEP